MDEKIQKEKDEEEERKWNDREHKFRLGLRWSSGSSTPASFGDSIGDDEENLWGSVKTSPDMNTERSENSFDNTD